MMARPLNVSFLHQGKGDGLSEAKLGQKVVGALCQLDGPRGPLDDAVKARVISIYN